MIQHVSSPLSTTLSNQPYGQVKVLYRSTSQEPTKTTDALGLLFPWGTAEAWIILIAGNIPPTWPLFKPLVHCVSARQRKRKQSHTGYSRNNSGGTALVDERMTAYSKTHQEMTRKHPEAQQSAQQRSDTSSTSNDSIIESYAVRGHEENPLQPVTLEAGLPNANARPCDDEGGPAFAAPDAALALLGQTPETIATLPIRSVSHIATQAQAAKSRNALLRPLRPAPPPPLLSSPSPSQAKRSYPQLQPKTAYQQVKARGIYPLQGTNKSDIIGPVPKPGPCIRCVAFDGDDSAATAAAVLVRRDRLVGSGEPVGPPPLLSLPSPVEVRVLDRSGSGGISDSQETEESKVRGVRRESKGSGPRSDPLTARPVDSTTEESGMTCGRVRSL